ncbi:ATP-binding protein [Cytobacillus firmus]|uniref:histidine kinase n=1 Tax=Cytobacillus firmus DS1 TaxID=1307436 RepID=W7L2X1_CYTFI|nr:ATP-binding protein [Cytobacillus firmus]EWG09951.1 PAS/PAC sensor hybrid histidine kinase [Cytobacillus firmus DS1]
MLTLSNHTFHPRVALSNNVEIANGSHILYTFSDQEKYIHNIVSFLSAGLELGHGVIFIEEKGTLAAVVERLREKGFSEEMLDGIVFAESDLFYGTNADLNLNNIVSTFSGLVDPYISNRIPLRTWAKVKWKENQCCLLENLRRFELEADSFVGSVKAFSVCAYDGGALPANIQLELMKSHPYVMTDLELFPSSLYQKDIQIPSFFIEEKQAETIKSLKEEFQHIHAHYKNLIEEMPDAVFVSAAEEIVYANKAAGILLGCTPDEITGKDMYDLFDWDQDVSENRLGESRPLTETKTQHTSGQKIDVEIMSFPFVFENVGKKAVISLVRDITGRKEMEKDLKEAKLNAEKSNHLKTVFLSQISHDLRTPLNSIQGFTQIMLMENQEEKDSRRLQRILDASHHLLELIDELLDFTAIETGNINMKQERIQLKPFIEDCIGSLAVNPHVSIEIGPIDEKLSVTADSLRLRQVLNNLLANALKYNRPGGYVHVYTEVEGADVKINIADTGVGIALDQLRVIFEPFYRANKDMDKWKGSGLGLAIVANLVEKMNGTYGVRSKEGVGTTFWVSFKANELPEKTAAHEPFANTMDEYEKTVLYIEDHHGNIELVREMLNLIGDIKFMAERNGESGFLRAVEMKPDIILLDLGLRDMNGLEVLNRLGENEATKDIPVIILSADALSASTERAAQLGCRDYITKPVDFEKLKRAILA